MWVLEVAGVDIPTPVLVAVGIIGVGMVSYGLWWVIPALWRSVRVIEVRSPVVRRTDGLSTSSNRAHPTNHREVKDGMSSPLSRVFMEGRRRDALVIHRAFNPWRIWYPLHLYNGAEVAVDVVGYNLNLLFDDAQIARVTWRAPDNEADNGIPLLPNHTGPIPAYTIQPGQPYTLSIPISRRQIADLPKANPKWGARGNVYLRCNGTELAHPYSFATDNYELERSVWVEWSSQ